MSKGISYGYSGTIGHIRNVILNLPNNPRKLLKNGWTNISHPAEIANGMMKLKEESTGLKVRFDQGRPDANGFAKFNHYHIYNPSATSKNNIYLNKNGDPVAKGSPASHILPEGD